MGHNSATGHGAAMGLATGKILSYSTRCKMCRVCSHKKLTGKEKKHDCRKNQNGSSKSMERDVACELWRKAPQSGVKFSIYVGDDDPTTLADIKNKVRQDLLILDYTILETASKDQIAQFSVQRL